MKSAPDAKSFFTGSRDNSAARWDTASGAKIQQYTGHSKWIQCLCVHGSKLYTGSADEDLKEWDIETGECLATMRGHTQEVTCMAADGNFLYTGSREAVARRWDLTTKECIREFSGHLSVVRDVGIFQVHTVAHRVHDLCICCQGHMFTGSADGTARCWNVDTRDTLFTITGHEFAGHLILACILLNSCCVMCCSNILGTD